jgi:hypothetical protein
MPKSFQSEPVSQDHICPDNWKTLSQETSPDSRLTSAEDRTEVLNGTRSTQTKTKSKTKAKVFITDKDLDPLRAAWEGYKTHAKTYRQSRLVFGKILSDLQKSKSHPGDGTFVDYIHKVVGIPTATAYRLIKHFHRVSQIVGTTEAFQQAAYEQEVDLTAKKWQPALKAFAPEIKKAEGVPECRAIIEKMAAFKPPSTTVKESAEAVAAAQLRYKRSVACKALREFLGNIPDEDTLTSLLREMFPDHLITVTISSLPFAIEQHASAEQEVTQ